MHKNINEVAMKARDDGPASNTGKEAKSSPISTRSGRRLSTGSAGPSPVGSRSSTPSQSPSTRAAAALGSKVVTPGVTLKATPSRSKRSTPGSAPGSASRGSVLDKLRANREKLEKQGKAVNSKEKESKGKKDTKSNTTELEETGKEEDKHVIEAKDEVDTGKIIIVAESNKLSAEKTSTEQEGDENEDKENDLDAEQDITDKVEDVIDGSTDGKDEKTDNCKTIEKESVSEETSKEAENDGNIVIEVTDSIDISSEDTDTESEYELDGTKKTPDKQPEHDGSKRGSERRRHEKVSGKLDTVEVKASELDIEKRGQSETKSSVDSKAGSKTPITMKTEPDTKGATPGSAGIRTRLKSGSIQMNGTMTISAAKEKADMENIVKQITKIESSPPAKPTPAVTKKRPSSQTPSAIMEVVTDNCNDYFCWLCHKEGTLVCCELCPRVYHSRCLGLSEALPQDWKIMRAECVDTRSKAMEMLTIDQLCTLLKYALDRMKHVGSEPFQRPVDLNAVRNYSDYVYHPMDLTMMEKMNEIELCPDCYLNSCVRKNDEWFSETCRVPHTLVWAKLKGYPFWPSKALRESDGQVDVRFFGAHDRSWVPPSQCFLLSKNIPTSLQKGKRNQGLDMAIRELNIHIKKLRERFGNFEYAPFRTPYDKSDSYKPVIVHQSPKKPSTTSVQRQSSSTGSMYAKPRPNIISKRTTHEEIITGKDGSQTDCVTKTVVQMADKKAETPKKTEAVHASKNIVDRLASKIKALQEMEEDNHADSIRKTSNESQKDDLTVLNSSVQNEVVEKADKQTDAPKETEKENDNHEIDKKDSVNVALLTETKQLNISNESDKEGSTGKDTMETFLEKTERESKEEYQKKLESLINSGKEKLGVKELNADLKDSESVSSDLDENDSELVEDTIDDLSSEEESGNDETEGKKSDMDSNSVDSCSAVETVNESSQESLDSLKESTESKTVECVKDTKESNLADEEQTKELKKSEEEAQTEELEDQQSENSNDGSDKSDKMEEEKGASEILHKELNEKITDKDNGKSKDSDGKDKQIKENDMENDKHNETEGQKVLNELGVVSQDATSEKKRKRTELDTDTECSEENDTSKKSKVTLDKGIENGVGLNVHTVLDSSSGELMEVRESASDSEAGCLEIDLDESVDQDKEKSVSEKDNETKTQKQGTGDSQDKDSSNDKAAEIDKQSEKSSNDTFVTKIDMQGMLRAGEKQASSLRPGSSASTSASAPTLETDGLEVMWSGDSSEFGKLPTQPPAKPDVDPNAELPTSSKIAEKFSKKEQVKPDNLDTLHKQLQLARWEYSTELNEIRHNFQLTMSELKACWVAEKEQILKSQKTQFDKEKEAAVADAKRKQWCASCGKEAIFYCCWNTSYCDYPCQQKHWPVHMHSCLQTNKNKPPIGAMATATSTVVSTALMASSVQTTVPIVTAAVSAPHTTPGSVQAMGSPLMFNMNPAVAQMPRQRFNVQPMMMGGQPHVSLQQSVPGVGPGAPGVSMGGPGVGMGGRMVFSQQQMVPQALYPVHVQPQQSLLFRGQQQSMMAYGMPRPGPF
ncbi:PKCB1-like protein [Mya arenaria]|uniref:PKCB1-like protein n=1 Tax=Mya arenaria TaxID=6604 RepID=A0ABY7F9H8_MYAAR|nr:PKCB1-like protein [Mya arenaria]